MKPHQLLQRKERILPMIALQLLDVKDFMHQLLRTELFDQFLLQEAVITTYITHSIDGRCHPEFFSSDTDSVEGMSENEFVPFSMLRPLCFDLIKGKQSPLAFKFIFQLSPANLERTLAQSGTGFTSEDVSAMLLQLKYQDKKLQCTTGISYCSFYLDRTLEQEWDGLVQKFFKNHKLPFELL
jgi:hypothetical protein